MSLRLAIFNSVNQLIPTRGFFAWRRGWLRWSRIHIGRQTRIASGARFYDTHISVGDDVWIGPEVSIYSAEGGEIRIGHRVDIAPGVLFVAGSHGLGDTERRAGLGCAAPIAIGDGTWIGARAVILGGAFIGNGCVVAAGAVVRAGAYPANVLLAGVPATVRKHLPSNTPMSEDTPMPPPTFSGTAPERKVENESCGL